MAWKTNGGGAGGGGRRANRERENKIKQDLEAEDRRADAALTETSEGDAESPQSKAPSPGRRQTPQGDGD